MSRSIEIGEVSVRLSSSKVVRRCDKNRVDRLRMASFPACKSAWKESANRFDVGTQPAPSGAGGGRWRSTPLRGNYVSYRYPVRQEPLHFLHAADTRLRPKQVKNGRHAQARRRPSLEEYKLGGRATRLDATVLIRHNTLPIRVMVALSLSLREAES